jgi:hypothetical protein
VVGIARHGEEHLGDLAVVSTLENTAPVVGKKRNAARVVP